MKKYVALLRGINVGGAKKVEMKKLKQLFEALGYEQVLTYINSGNIIFAAADGNQTLLVKQIETATERSFGFEIKVVIREGKNLVKLAQAIHAQWNNDIKQRTEVLFLWDEYDSPKSLELIKIVKGVDVLRYFPGAIAWNVQRNKYNKSAMHKFIGTELYKHMTGRNINTVRKLAELIKQP